MNEAETTLLSLLSTARVSLTHNKKVQNDYERVLLLRLLFSPSLGLPLTLALSVACKGPDYRTGQLVHGPPRTGARQLIK